MPRFVVLQHAPPAGSTQPVHWDFMFEQEGVLLTWALVSSPGSASPIAAQRLDNHRLIYLDYEGEISGNRGHVIRWDRGECEILAATDKRLTAQVAGQHLQGDVELARTRSPGAWQFRFVPRSPGNSAR